MPRPLPDVLPAPWPDPSGEPPLRTALAIERAAALLAEGGLVAIPTETVYGLAADALDAAAVDRIFQAKGRPATNPLIVHVADAAMARTLAAAWPAAAEKIVSRHWPGPVTVIVPRGPRVPAPVTAGGPTVALRCPEHPLARRLIAVLGRPLAAPSANRSMQLSPTTAGHVLEGLGSRVDLILDAGPCGRGIESTVVDCTVTPPRILRPGPIGRVALEQTIGGIVEESSAADAGAAETVPRSPGSMARHYAPQTPLEVIADTVPRVSELVAAGRRVAWLTTRTAEPAVRALAAAASGLVVVPMPPEPVAFAASLYATLHAADRRGFDTIVIEAPPLEEGWRAVADRLARAATPPAAG
ncbi:MAG: Threonylcarbamoyl-AMP synthase [Planctomycetota bacterium]|jgi:L-threonylcarbamoyladenylate synthase